MDQVVDAHLQTVLQVQPHGPYHFIGYSLGGTLAQGIAARLQARGEQVAFLGLLDTYPPETQNWDVMLDDNVLKEVQREREQFTAVSQDTLDPALGETRTAMFDNIEANYADSVRLLSHTRTARFRGGRRCSSPNARCRKGWTCSRHGRSTSMRCRRTSWTARMSISFRRRRSKCWGRC